MGSAISKSNKDYINNNWDKLKCSPIGPFLQMTGIAPGSSGETSTACKSSEFSSQFNSSMSDHINITSKLTGGLNAVSGTINTIRQKIASIEQEAFNDLSKVATEIFNIYVKIGNIFFTITKNLINIMGIFKSAVNLGASISDLMIGFINLVMLPINGIMMIIELFARM
jgi:hypothetical protein